MVSRCSLIAYASSFDQIGILTKKIEDNAKFSQVIAGPDEKNLTLKPDTLPDFNNLSRNSNPFKIAILKETIQYPILDKYIHRKIKDIIYHLKNNAIQVNEISFHWLDYIVPTFHVLAPAEAMSNLARYDGTNFGYRVPFEKNDVDLITETRSKGFGKKVKQRILTGTYILHENNRALYKKH